MTNITKPNRKYNPNPKVIEKILGFDKIREILIELATSVPGKNAIENLELSNDIRIILSDLDLVTEMKKILTSTSFPIHGIHDVKDIVTSIIGENQSIEPSFLYKIGKTLTAARAISTFTFNKKDVFPDIYEICLDLMPFEDIEETITKSIDSDGEILDTASSELRRIRARFRSTENKIRSKMREVFESYKRAGYSRDEEITIRNGRLVLPIKAESRNRINGVIHDESSTGSTLFVEPIESLELNAELNRIRKDEYKEIDRIIKAIVASIFVVKEDILFNLELLVELDVLYAKAKFSIKYDCYQVNVNTKNIVNIYDGYHPLLVKNQGVENVVPLSLEIGEKYNTLVITGPNAGGKTVTLKTVGLFAMMIKAGMHIPAGSHSNIAIFNYIFADIGDDQSIENDLSTFSSHISKLSMILKKKNNDNLILLDEIGASTDPAEGSAISMAILKELTARKQISIATTHQGVLKSFAYKSKGINNGSMEFDRKNISPTYRFRPDIPGSSYAFEISSRHGLPGYIIKNAKQYLGSEKQNLETLISDLDEKITNYNTMLRKSTTTKNDMLELKEHYNKKFEDLKKKEKLILKDATQKGKDIISTANRMIEKTVKEIRSSKADKKVVKDLRLNIVKEDDKISRKLDTLKKDVKETTRNTEEIDKKYYTGEIKENLEVKLKNMNNWGVISNISGKNRIEVSIGSMVINVKKKDIEFLREANNSDDSHNIEISFNLAEPDGDDIVGLRLDLRGMRGDAAVSKVEKYLDDCARKSFTTVEIVHGKGEGILDKLVSKVLDKSSLVKSKRYGKQGEGDYGVTVVEFK